MRVATSTIAGYTSNVRGFYRWAVEGGRLEVGPSTRLPSPKVPRRFPRPIPELDLRTALVCAAEPIRTWLVLAGFMGLRCAEIAGITAESVLEVDGRLYLQGVGKGSKPFRFRSPSMSSRCCACIWSAGRRVRCGGPHRVGGRHVPAT